MRFSKDSTPPAPEIGKDVIPLKSIPLEEKLKIICFYLTISRNLYQNSRRMQGCHRLDPPPKKNYSFPSAKLNSVLNTLPKIKESRSSLSSSKNSSANSESSSSSSNNNNNSANTNSSKFSETKEETAELVPVNLFLEELIDGSPKEKSEIQIWGKSKFIQNLIQHLELDKSTVKSLLAGIVSRITFFF